MSEIIIPSGVTSGGLVANSGDVIIVEAGGTLVEGVINEGGILSATQDAVIENLTAATGATVELTGAAKTSGAILKGANTNIAAGTLYYMGTAIGGEVANGVLTNLNGVYRICAGAGITVSDPTVGGETTVGVRVYARETAVVSGGSVTTSGNIGLLGESYGNEVTVGGEGVTNATLNTFDQATADNTTVSAGGNFQIRNAAENTTVHSGGLFQVYNGGVAEGVTVNSGGSAAIWAGGVANNVNVGSIGYLRVSGGTVNNVSIGSGGQLVFSGGVINGGVISGGYYVNGKFTSTSFHVSGGGTLKNVTLTTIFNTNPGTQQAIFCRLGWTNATQVGHGENLTVEKWTLLQLANGNTSNTTVISSGKFNVIAYANKGAGFASATHTVVASGGTALTSSYNGKTNVEMTDTWLNYSGVAVVGSGGKMYDTVLNSGGTMTVSSSGEATLDDHPWLDKSHLTVKTGGTVTSARNYNIYYGKDDGVTGLTGRTKDRQVDWQVNADSAVVCDGAVISGGEVADGATLVMKGGWFSGATIAKGATAKIYGGTVLDIAAVPIGGTLSVSGAALISGGYIGGNNNSANCTFYATSGAELRNVTFTNVGNNSKTNVIWCYLGNTASAAAVGSADLYDCTVEKGARVQMYHGCAYDTDVVSGGWLAIAWGSASRTNISGGQFNGAGDGARMILYYDLGRTYETTVGSGGSMCVSKGKAFGTTVLSGGSMTVENGSASGLVLEKGAVLRMSGGVVSGATIRTNVAGGYVTGGTMYDTLIEGPSAAETLNFSMTKSAVMSGGVVKTDATDTHVEQFFVASNAKIYDVTFTTDIVAAGSNQNYTRLGWAAGNVGYAYRCTVQSGAKMQMNNGRVYDTTVKDGGYLVVWGYTADGAYAENTSVYGNGYNTWYYAGNKSNYGAVVQCYAEAGKGQAIMSGAYIGSGGFIDIGLSGAVINVLVNSGGSMRLNNATASAYVAYNPFIGEYTAALIRKNYTAAVLTYQTVDEREYNVYYGANDGHTGLISRAETTMDDLTVATGQSAIVYNGGTMNDLTVENGGSLYMSSGAVVRGLVLSGGMSTYEATSADGVNYGASAYDVTVASGGSIFFASGNYLSNVTIASGGSINVSHFGQIHNTVISNGGQIELRTNGIATSNMVGGVTLDLAGSTEMDRYMVTRYFHYISVPVSVKANGSVCNASYWICSNAGVTTLGNAFKLDIGGGMVYDTNDNGTTMIYDPLHDLVYSRTRLRIGETANYDLKLETIVDSSGLDTYQGVAESLSLRGEGLNGVDTGIRWTDQNAYVNTVYVAEGLTDGNAWLEIDGTDVSGALYGAAADQNFAGAVNMRFMDGYIRNLAAGAAAGGSVKDVNFRMDDGTLGGNAYLGGMGGVTEAVTASVEGGELAKGKNLYAGALWNKQSTATAVGSVNLTVKGDVEIKGNLYGASAVKTGTIATAENDAAKHTVGDVTLTLAGGTTAENREFCVFAGGYATGHDTAKLAPVYTVGSVTVDITGGTWGEMNGGRGIFGGAFASDNIVEGTGAMGVWAQVGDVNLTVSGDAAIGNVYGGGWAQKNGTSTVGNVNITITGEAEVANVYGGGSHSTSGGTTEAGNVTITVSGGNITGDIFARGHLEGDTTGAAEVTFTGSTDYSCGVYGYLFVPPEEEDGTDTDAKLSFTGYTGSFAGGIGGFNGVTFGGSTAMTITTAAADVDNTAWIFDAAKRDSGMTGTAFLNWTAADFTGGTIALNLASGNTNAWSLVSAATDTNYYKFDVQVDETSILSKTLELDEQIASGDYAGWGFTNENGTLKFKQLA